MRPEPGTPLVSVRDLHVHFGLNAGTLGRLLGRSAGAVKAVDGVSFDLRRGEVLGVVGESGSGKTTLGRAILRTVPITSGDVSVDGVDLAELKESQIRPLRRRMQMVFQDPNAALNPAMDLLTAIGHPLRIHGVTDDEDEIRKRVSESLERVGLAPVEQYLHKYPADLSGGQKQRAVIARAIILGPELLIADEPVSMLDMSVRAKILELMLELKRDLGLTYLYVTHDLATAKFFCDTIAIMYLGRIVEYGPAEQVYADPKHPYTQALLRAVPEPDPNRIVERDLPRGEIPDAAVPPLGCSFHPRCPVAFEICGWESRDLRDLLDRHWLQRRGDDYERERDLIGDMSALDEPLTDVTVPAGRGSTSSDVMRMLERIREDDPDEPMWRGVTATDQTSSGVRVQFREDAVDPPLYDAGDTGVACLLHRPAVHIRQES